MLEHEQVGASGVINGAAYSGVRRIADLPLSDVRTAPDKRDCFPRASTS